MYSIYRGNLPNKSNNHLLETKDHNNFSPNEHGIYVPNGPTIYNDLNEQSQTLAKYSYTKYPVQMFKEKLTQKLTELTELTEVAELNKISKKKVNLSLQGQLVKDINDILDNIKENAGNFEDKFIKEFIKEPIIDQTQIPKLANISETSKTLSVLYSTIYDNKCIQNLNYYISAKSFFYAVKESPYLKEKFIEVQPTMLNKIITKVTNIYHEVNLLNLKKVMYPLDSNMPFYFSNESGVFRSKEFLQTIECIHSDIMPGNYYIKTLKGPGDLYYKEGSKPDFFYLELKTGDLPQPHMDNLLNNIYLKYHMINNLIICFDVKSIDQQNQITDYLIKYKITNVTSIFINNAQFYSDNQYYNYDHVLQNSLKLDPKTLYFLYNNNLQEQYLDNLKKQSLKKNNKINLIESEDKLDELVDSEILNKIKEYQEVGNILELIDNTKLSNIDLDNINTYDQF